MAIFAVAATGLWAVTFWVVRTHASVGDEIFHYSFIRGLLRDGFNVRHVYDLGIPLTTLPGYHLAVAGLARLTGAEDWKGLRTISFLISLAAIGVFYMACRTLKTEKPALRTLQFACFPLAFPYFFLLYTDILCLTLFFISFLLIIRGKTGLAVAVSVLAFFVRQTHLFWHFFLWWWWATRVSGKEASQRWRGHLFFALGSIIFVSFMVVNRGVAVASRELHPFFVFHPRELYFSLLVFFVMFFPEMLRSLPEIVPWFKRSRNILLMLAMFAGYLAVIAWDNSYWALNLTLWPGRIFRSYPTAGFIQELIFFLPTACAGIWLAVNARLTGMRALLVVTVLAMLPVTLIEPRYLLTSFSLLLLFRPVRDECFERLMSVYFFMVSSVFVYDLIAGTYRYDMSIPYVS